VQRGRISPGGPASVRRQHDSSPEEHGEDRQEFLIDQGEGQRVDPEVGSVEASVKRRVTHGPGEHREVLDVGDEDAENRHAAKRVERDDAFVLGDGSDQRGFVHGPETLTPRVGWGEARKTTGSVPCAARNVRRSRESTIMRLVVVLL
jgi:hypothetical protein